MLRQSRLAISIMACIVTSTPCVTHASTIVTGKIVIAEGHQSTTCRRLFLRQTDGTLMVFRIGGNGTADGILPVALTALTSGLTVDLSYTPGVGTGCGAEPAVEYVSLKAPGA